MLECTNYCMRLRVLKCKATGDRAAAALWVPASVIGVQGISSARRTRTGGGVTSRRTRLPARRKSQDVLAVSVRTAYCRTVGGRRRDVGQLELRYDRSDDGVDGKHGCVAHKLAALRSRSFSHRDPLSSQAARRFDW